MTEQEVFVAADKALGRVVAQIGDDQWEQIVPENLTPRQPGSSLRQVVAYHAYDDAWVPDVLAGLTKEQVGDRHDGDLLGADPKAAFAAIVATAVTAVRAFRDLDKIVHLSYGDYPAARVPQAYHLLSRSAGLRPGGGDRRRHDASRGSRARSLGADRAGRRRVAQDGGLRAGRAGARHRAAAGPLARPHRAQFRPSRACLESGSGGNDWHARLNREPMTAGSLEPIRVCRPLTICVPSAP